MPEVIEAPTPARDEAAQLHPHRRGRTVVLPGGEHVHVRAISAADRDELARGYEQLSPESRRLRFLVPPHHLTEQMLTYLTDVNGVDHVGLVALAQDEPDQPGIGVARYVRLPDEPDTAEVAVTVLDAYQGRGVGAQLLAMILEEAVRNHVRRIRGYVAPDNRILDLARAAGASIVAEDSGVVRVELDLPRSVRRLRAAFRGIHAPAIPG